MNAKNFYEVGQVYIWHNCTGRWAYLNGKETTVTGDAMHYMHLLTKRIMVGQCTDTPAADGNGFVIALKGELRPKNPPPGERSVMDLFKLPECEPA